MKKYLFILFLCIGLKGVLHAQTPFPIVSPGWYDNMEKYWWYRYRLVNDFMQIGPNCGESIPAIARVYPNSWGTEGNSLSWGDDATIHLGHYIGTLGVEYRLLKNRGWDTWRTERELYYALRAARRLDESAESYNADIDNNSMCKPKAWSPPFGNLWNNFSPNSLNGYFLRDDVWYDNTKSGPDRKDDFVSVNQKHFNRPGSYYHPTKPVGVYSPSMTVTGTYPPSVELASPPYAPHPVTEVTHVGKTSIWDITPAPSGWSASTPRITQEESADQATDMFLGLSIATKLLDNGINVESIPDLRYEAGASADRIVSWFPKPIANPSPEAYLGDIIPNILTGAAPYNWSIKNPQTLKCVGSPGSSNCLAGAFGPCTYAWSASRAVRHAIGGSIPSLWPQSEALVLMSAWPNYKWFFQNMQYWHVTSGSKDLTFVDAYTAVSGAWELTLPTTPLSLPINTSWKTIRNHAMNQHFCEPHLPLIYRMNFNKPDIGFSPESHVDISYDYLLNSAPKCGPYHYYITDRKGQEDVDAVTDLYHNVEWSGPNRLSEWYKRDGYEYMDHSDNCEYNGLDYMMLFDLYAYQKPGYLRYLINPYYTKDYDVNYPDGGHGDFSHQLTLNWLEYISFRNTIQSDGFVRFRGAHELEALPGFEAKSGCVFEAFVQDYVCMGEEGDYHFAQERVGESDVYHENYIEYSPNTTTFSARPLDDSDLIRSNIEDSLADIPITEDEIQSLKDSLNYYISGITDPEALAYLASIGLIDSPTTAGRQVNNGVLTVPANDKVESSIEIFPNPTHEVTSVVYTISRSSSIQMTLTNSLGQEYNYCIKSFERQQAAGKHTIYIDTEQLTPGIYYVRLQIGNQQVVKKLTVM